MRSVRIVGFSGEPPPSSDLVAGKEIWWSLRLEPMEAKLDDVNRVNRKKETKIGELDVQNSPIWLYHYYRDFFSLEY